MTLAIETIELTHRYKKLIALDRLNLQVPQGCIYGFIGPNGAGKTTTLRLLAGLQTPTSGEIRLMGERLTTRLAQRFVGYMPDFFGVYDDLRVWEYLDFFARCYGLRGARLRQVVDELLELVDLSDKRDAFVQTLSRGMQQRLCLAHALVHDPLILLLDEPASGLDPRARVELRELLRTLRSMGKTIMLSSHILSELAEVCDAIGIIDHGRMLISGPLAEVQQQLATGSRVRMRIARESDVVLALTLLQHQPLVQAVSTLPADPRSLIVDFTQPVGEEQCATFLAELVSAGVAISEFSARSENLEEFFLRLTMANTG
ncbi:MAG: ABC transporter ATP-binding protein [Chloroflexus sp.]|nr:ABC transporter ATP-binding protein [Chloroflexus sp.]MBO9319795.1 ABC transporter ATP-binding protein [Chloroflexus sp.]MBO9372534.1 ABC transporter ATP-binding protein [Chloroflexus sp.]